MCDLGNPVQLGRDGTWSPRRRPVLIVSPELLELLKRAQEWTMADDDDDDDGPR